MPKVTSKPAPTISPPPKTQPPPKAKTGALSTPANPDSVIDVNVPPGFDGIPTTVEIELPTTGTKPPPTLEKQEFNVAEWAAKQGTPTSD